MQPHFSHIYVEKGVSDAPFAQEILKKFPRAQIVPIDDYRNRFNAPGQDFALQKRSKKLILAAKKDKFIYPGNDKVQQFGYQNFAYNTLLLNCAYNCAYCYLQGMFNSANMVAFVNIEDFFSETKHAIQERQNKDEPLHLAISYDTDLLASESILPYCRKWIEFCRRQRDLRIEIRTKSANASALDDVSVCKDAILAWTLSPQAIVERYETQTPSFSKRLRAAKRALEQGWTTRLCFDPIIPIDGWQTLYQRFLDTVFSELPPHKIDSISIGVFRITEKFFDRLKKTRPDTDLIHQSFSKDEQILTLPHQQRLDITGQFKEYLGQYVALEKISIWT